MAFSTTGLVNMHVITSWRSLLQAYQHTCDHIMAFSTTGLVNMHVNTHVITSWRSLLQAYSTQ